MPPEFFRKILGIYWNRSVYNPMQPHAIHLYVVPNFLLHFSLLLTTVQSDLS